MSGPEAGTATRIKTEAPMNAPLNLPLARSAVDRDYLSRLKPELLAELIAEPTTMVLPVFDGKVLLQGELHHPDPALKLFAFKQIDNFEFWAYLGRTTEAQNEQPKGSAVIMVSLTREQAAGLEPNVAAWHVLRRTGGGLSDRDSGIYVQGLALANWHQSHQHCSKCGSETQITQAGWVRVCSRDGNSLFPRTDPAVIVAVIDQQDRILLGSQGVWEDNRWSVLAGFVEPGESLNAAVIREMHEEAGVHVVDPHYLGSQSWPFPYSLMMGFSATIDPARPEIDLVPDGDEIEKLRWFSRAELAAEAKNMLLPGRITIARSLIEHWYGGLLESASEAKA